MSGRRFPRAFAQVRGLDGRRDPAAEDDRLGRRRYSQATHEYYRLFNEGVRDALGGHEAAEVLISSMNFGVIERLLRAGRWNELGDYVAEKAVQLERGGADFILLVSHTLHKVANRIIESVSVPFVDMIDVTAAAVRSRGLTRIGLLGTHATMADPFYRGRYSSLGVELLAPDEPSMVEVDRIIFDELCRAQILPNSREFYVRVIKTLEHSGAQGVILGCTEIPLLIREADLDGFPSFDMGRLHTSRAVEIALKGVARRA